MFAVNAATPRSRITAESAVALSQHGTVAPVTVHQRIDFVTSMIDGRSVMELNPESRSSKEMEGLWDYLLTRLGKVERRAEQQPFEGDEKCYPAREQMFGNQSARPGFGRRHRPPLFGQQAAHYAWLRKRMKAMTEQAITRAKGALFAIKGDAAPSPSTDYASIHQFEGQPKPAVQETSWVDPGPRFRIPDLEAASAVGPASPSSTVVQNQGKKPPALAGLIRRRNGPAPVLAPTEPAPVASATMPQQPAATAIDPQRVLSIPHGGGRNQRDQDAPSRRRGRCRPGSIPMHHGQSANHRPKSRRDSR